MKTAVNTESHYIRKMCIPSTESGTEKLTQGNLQCPFDPDTQTYRLNPETLKQAGDLESRLGTLPASLLNPENSA